METDAQRLAAFRRDTGLTVTLRPHERLIATRADETQAVVTIITYRVAETARELRFTAKGTKMMAWTKDSAGQWQPLIHTQPDGSRTGYMVMWDDTYVPEITVKLGRITTPEDARAQREWEKDCYRPGTGRSPLDNYDRVLEGAYSPVEVKMERYW